MSMEALRSALANKVTDQFQAGDVIRWTALGRYTYAAIKISDGRWYTTAAANNGYVNKILTFNELVDVLARAESTDIALASSWETVL